MVKLIDGEMMSVEKQPDLDVKEDVLKFGKGNLISTIEECLKEHQVEISDGKNVVPMYLIMGSAKSSLSKDFIDVYGDELSEFKEKLAKKLLGEKESEQTYGILVDTDLQYKYAFNRKFADIDITGKKIAFANDEDFLLQYTKQSRGENFFESGQHEKLSFDHVSLLDRIRSSYAEKSVRLEVGGVIDTFYMVTTTYKTNRRDDFLKTYGDGADEFKMELAKQAFGDELTNNEYCLFFDTHLKIRYAFNTMFAAYDSETISVIYQDAEEVLLRETKGKDLAAELKQQPVPVPRRRTGGLRRRRPRMVFKYSLVGKKDKAASA